MKKLLTQPLKLGNLILKNRVIYAPLAGCSDFPFRQMVARYRPGLMFCEMVKMDALVRHDPNTFHLLDYDASMHPIGAQICGSNPSVAGKAAQMIEELGFDLIDLNCGCPVDKVTKDGSGSGMLKTPELIGEVVSAMVAAVSIPVTVKIRVGWDEHSINAPEITQIVEKSGARAIFVHGRTRKQAYRGPANWSYIKECVEAAREIVVVGNGGVMDGESASKMVEETGCGAVLVSRGTLGHPWIVEDILRFDDKPPIKRTLEGAREALLEHFLKVVDYQRKRSVVSARRIGCWYLKSSPGTRGFREKISRVENEEKALELIRSYPLTEEKL